MILENYLYYLEEKYKSEKEYKIGMIIHVNNKMQKNYSYKLVQPVGKNFEYGFKPFFSPRKMLEMGVFEGKYLNDCKNEYPKEWFLKAKLSPIKANPSINYFGIKSRQSLQEWQRKGWIIGDDPRGWFEWYCRYYLGRRDSKIDKIQISRWKGIVRHSAQVKKHCKRKDIECRPKQRQALLQWSYDPFVGY